MSEDTNLTCSTPAVAIGFSRRTIALLMAAIVGLTVRLSLLMTAVAGGASPTRWTRRRSHAKALTDHECDATEWHFVITQIDSAANAPATITVTWANGASEVVPLYKFTGGVAHYVTTSNLDSTVVSATADIYSGWSGQFNLSHGPCGPTTPPTTPPTSPSGSPTT